VRSTVEVEGSLDTGWASSTFNNGYVGIDKSALNLITMGNLPVVGTEGSRLILPEGPFRIASGSREIRDLR